MIPFDLQGRTDRLETILQAVEQSQQTGIINVQRGKGGVSEKGSISFLYGQAVDATAGEHTGTEAWNWVKTWNSCQYTFTQKSPAEISVPPSRASEASSSHNKTLSPLAFMAQILPRTASQETTKPESHDAHPVLPAQPVESPPARLVEQLPFQPTEPVRMPAASAPPYNTPPSLPAFHPPSHHPLAPETPLPQTYQAQTTYAPASRIPFRLLQGSEALSYITKAKLTRQHRHIFFLLDGQRTVDDLTRLTGHHITDTLRLLADLERIGLIRQQ